MLFSGMVMVTRNRYLGVHSTPLSASYSLTNVAYSLAVGPRLPRFAC